MVFGLDFFCKQPNNFLFPRRARGLRHHSSDRLLFFGSDLQSVDTLRSSRFARRSPNLIASQQAYSRAVLL